MRNPGALTLLAALLVPGAALACTCMWAGPFTKAALGSQLVVLAAVRSHDRRRMDVTVLDVLRAAERRRVLGGDDANCRLPVAGFPPGTRWLFALQFARTAQCSPSCSRRRLMASSWSSDSRSFGRLMCRLMRIKSSRPMTRIGRPPMVTVSAWGRRSSYVPIGSR
jgi:hypothetical protein